MEQLRVSAQVQGGRTQILLSAFLNDRVSATPLAPGLSSDLRQTGLGLQGRYQLDGTHALSLAARHLITESVSGSSQAKLSSLIGAWNMRLSPLWGLTAGARIQQQSGQGTVAEFDEVAVFLATDYRFR
jgi:beta-lactamase class A